MERINREWEPAMRRFLCILARIVASIVGFLVGVYATIFAIAWGIQLIPSLQLEPDDDAAFFLGLFIVLPVALFTGGPLGAATGATVAQKAMRQRSSFWKGLLGAVVGLVAGVSTMALCLWTLYVLGVWHDGWWPFFVAIAVVLAATVAGAVIGSGWKAKPAEEAQN